MSDSCIVEVALLSPRSYFAALPTAWEITRARLIDFGATWEVEEAITDLRWWEDRIRMKVALAEEKRPRKFMPSERELARWWGWSKQRAGALRDARHTWADPAHVENPAPVRRRLPEAKPPICADSGAAMGQPWGSVGAAMGHLTTEVSQECLSIGAAMGHPRGSDGAATGRHMRASSQGTASQDTGSQKKEGGRLGAPRRSTPTAPPSVSSSKAVRGWGDESVLRVWAEAWKATNRGRPCTGNQDQRHSAQLAVELNRTETSRDAFLAACVNYLREQEAGRAFPPSGVPLIGHIKRIWRDFLPGSRSAPAPTRPPWEAPYTSSPVPMWAMEDARRWAERNREEVHLIWEAIREHGGGVSELVAWLRPRVSRPDDVLTALREQRETA